MLQDNTENGKPPADPWAPSIDRFSGYAREYDSCRPQPPGALVDFLADLAHKAPLDRVIDLGCGTGLSTRIWADRAVEVIGVDPSADMIAQAQRATKVANVRYLCRLGHDTGLPDHSADIVTCGMSLHWMDPEMTARELRRILRPGGVFGTYWEHWSSPFVAVERAFRELENQVEELDAKLGSSAQLKRWPRRTQEKLLVSCGLFQFTKEIAFHHVATLTADQLTQMVKTLGAVMVLVKQGLSEDEIGLTRFREVASKAFGSEPRRIYHTWGLWYGVAGIL